MTSAAFPSGFYVTGKSYNHAANTSELWFTKHDLQGQITGNRTVFSSISRTNSGDQDCWGALANGENTLFLFEQSSYTSLRDDRQAIYYQVRDSAGNLVRPTRVISPGLLPDSTDQDDEYEIDSAISDRSGQVWVSFNHYRSGQPYENYCVIIGSDGNVRTTTLLGNEVWRKFRFCDKDGYIWATQDSSVLIFDHNSTQIIGPRTTAYIPNQDLGNATVARDWAGGNYRVYDRWTPQTLQIDIPEGSVPSSIEIYDLNLWNNNLHPANLNVKKNDATVWSQSGQFTGHDSINTSGLLKPGQNILMMNQDDFQGGQILATFPYMVSGDFNNNGLTDFFDFAVMAKAWESQPGQVNWNNRCDISNPQDSRIDSRDLAILASMWLSGVSNADVQSIYHEDFRGELTWTPSNSSVYIRDGEYLYISADGYLGDGAEKIFDIDLLPGKQVVIEQRIKLAEYGMNYRLPAESIFFEDATNIAVTYLPSDPGQSLGWHFDDWTGINDPCVPGDGYWDTATADYWTVTRIVITPTGGELYMKPDDPEKGWFSNDYVRITSAVWTHSKITKIMFKQSWDSANYIDYIDIKIE
jgi:hypothetical protein